jgi:hypothetical protein
MTGFGEKHSCFCQIIGVGYIAAPDIHGGESLKSLMTSLLTDQGRSTRE